ncbi:hypothetical protein BKH46_08835 [Helicobacter sp. 12S02634-8]|nr:hypothetical protein BKH46_08835 [Helicobacter sp. 12S02634-8]
MQVIKTERFKTDLESILAFIATHSPQNAINFKNELLQKLFQIPQMPYSHRKSRVFNQENIRELVFKGFVVIYRITENIEILGIYKSNIWEWEAQ